jgi:putative heme-binding domain-containing protein
MALRIAGESMENGSPQEVIQMLKDPAPDVRVEAACAIARLRPPGSAEALIAALTACGDSDPFLRHALTYALSRVLTPAELSARGRASTSPHFKTAALNALRRLHAAQTADFLTDENPEIVLAAAVAIYDGMILPGYPPLAAALEKCTAQPELIQGDFIHRALAAALRTGTAAEAAAVAAFAALPPEKLPAEWRTAAIQTLTTWDNPPSYEAVHGRFDPPVPRLPGIARPFLLKLKPPATSPSLDSLIAAIGDGAQSDNARIDALQQLAALNAAKALEVSRGLLPGHGTARLRAAARTVIMKLDAAASYKLINETLAAGSPQEMQAVLQKALRFDSRQAEALWLDLGKKFVDGGFDPMVRLEVLEGLRHRDIATRGKFRRLLETAEGNLDEAVDPLARWHLCETGGDPDKGRLLFETGRLLNCTECHSLHGRGGSTGPELDRVASRLNNTQLLASLVQPSSLIAQGYGRVTVTLQDGTHSTGLLRKRDDTSLLLATRNGIRHINADAVKSLSDPVSPMPSATALLTPREIRDLVAWLATLKQ